MRDDVIGGCSARFERNRSRVLRCQLERDRIVQSQGVAFIDHRFTGRQADNPCLCQELAAQFLAELTINHMRGLKDRVWPDLG